MYEYLKEINIDASSSRAMVMLPDIWGITDYSIQTAQEFSNEFAIPVYLLDYFYELTGKPSKFNLQTDQSLAVGLMDRMTGEDFTNIFGKAISEIKIAQPELESIIVIGFCFGGRLAYLGGLNSKVKKIVSFYGAGAHTPNYYDSKSPIQALGDTRSGDSSLSILSFYGSQDASIPESDRQLTLELLKNAGISYVQKIYDSGHAYFQSGREQSYNQAAANSSWQDLKGFINN